MKNFHFWTDWGIGLSDKNFANAFMALGILMARSRFRPLSGSKVVDFPLSNPLQGFLEKELENAVCERLSKDGLPALTPWKFPQPNALINLETNRLDLSHLDPLWLSLLWESVAKKIPPGNMSQRLRLEVKDYPQGEPARPWFRMLFEAAPEDNAVHLSIKTTPKTLHIKWPLRLGFLPGNSAEPIVMGASMVWPSNENSVPVQISRENDNCDVLVFDGGITALHQELKKLPVPMKCHLFFLRGPAEENSPAFFDLLNTIATTFHSSGFVLLKQEMTDKDFLDSINNFVTNFCHNMPMDGAISAGFRYYPAQNADPLIILGTKLSNIRLKDLVNKTIKALKDLPRDIKIDLPPGTLDRLNIRGYGYIEPEKTGELFKTLVKYREAIRYDAESTGATGLSEINRSLCRAEIPKMAGKKQMNRFIQAQSFIRKKDRFEIEERAFVKGMLSRIRVRIGPPDKVWESMPEAFPVDKLPEQKEAWRLSVVLGEPTHLKDPIVKKIKLPRFGPSTECDFEFTPKEAVDFDGQITIIHRGRVIQTALLKMPVVEDMKGMPRRKKLELAEHIAVRVNIGEMEERRQFDMAFVTNHTSDKRPHLTAIASDHAWLMNLEACSQIAEEINMALSEVAVSVEDYKDGLDSKEGKELLLKLAFFGRDLYDAIVEAGLKAVDNKEKFAEKEYLQIVSTRSDAVIPFEFIYDHETPDDDAELCGFWREALTEGKCPASCSKNGRKTICPLGFWGLSKVIERHDLTPEFSVNNPDYILQSETAANRTILNFSGTGLVAASERVTTEQMDELIAKFTNAIGIPPVKADDWKHWEILVNQHKPHLLVALPHSDGEGTLATLEINHKTIKSVQIRESHVRPQDGKDFPIVALLGCDTTGTAMRYGSFVQKFRLRGASIVIGTIASVFGGHAAKVAAMLVQGLTDESPKYERLGEIMRSVKRKALLDGLLMSLCVVAFGDADWKLTK